MRIAAKRLRYVLEIIGHCFGAAGARAQEEAKWLQEVLGEIHDCDVLIPRVEEEIATAALARTRSRSWIGRRTPDALPALVRGVPNGRVHRGLVTLEAALQARRRLLYARFLDRWDTLIAQGFRTRLENALALAERRDPGRRAG